MPSVTPPPSAVAADAPTNGAHSRPTTPHGFAVGRKLPSPAGRAATPTASSKGGSRDTPLGAGGLPISAVAAADGAAGGRRTTPVLRGKPQGRPHSHSNGEDAPAADHGTINWDQGICQEDTPEHSQRPPAPQPQQQEGMAELMRDDAELSRLKGQLVQLISKKQAEQAAAARGSPLDAAAAAASPSAAASSAEALSSLIDQLIMQDHFPPGPRAPAPAHQSPKRATRHSPPISPSQQQQQPQQQPQHQQQHQPQQAHQPRTPEQRGGPSRQGSAELPQGGGQTPQSTQRETIADEVQWALSREAADGGAPPPYSAAEKRSSRAESDHALKHSRPAAPTPQGGGMLQHPPQVALVGGVTVSPGFSPWPPTSVDAVSAPPGAAASGVPVPQHQVQPCFHPLQSGESPAGEHAPGSAAPPPEGAGSRVGWVSPNMYPPPQNLMWPLLCPSCAHHQLRVIRRQARRLRRLEKAEQRARHERSRVSSRASVHSRTSLRHESGSDTTGNASRVGSVHLSESSGMRAPEKKRIHRNLKSPRSAFSEPTSASRSSYTCSDSPESSQATVATTATSSTTTSLRGLRIFERFGHLLPRLGWFQVPDKGQCWSCGPYANLVESRYEWLQQYAAPVQTIMQMPPQMHVGHGPPAHYPPAYFQPAMPAGMSVHGHAHQAACDSSAASSQHPSVKSARISGHRRHSQSPHQSGKRFGDPPPHRTQSDSGGGGRPPAHPLGRPSGSAGVAEPPADQ